MESGESQEGMELLKLYNLSQTFLIKYMIQTGVIKDVDEYTENYAEAFEMLAKGTLQCPRKMDWREVKKKVGEVAIKIGNTMKSII